MISPRAISFSRFLTATGMLLASNAFGSVVEPFYKWTKPTVTVCWINTDRIPEERYTPGQLLNMPVQSQLIRISDDQKAKIRESVQTNYSASRTGISFKGWKDCSDSVSFDAVIYATDSGPPGSSSIGRLTSSDIDGKYSPIDRNKLAFVVVNTRYAEYKKATPQSTFRLSPDEYLKFLFLHEFGHLAGLRHEHLRPASRGSRICSAAGHLSYSETAHEKTQAFGTYDDISIMNYCYLEFLSMNSARFYAYEKEPSYEITSRFDAPWGFESSVNSELPASRKDLGDTITEYFIEIGLSEKDAQGLRCLYSVDSGRKCRTSKI